MSATLPTAPVGSSRCSLSRGIQKIQLGPTLAEPQEGLHRLRVDSPEIQLEPTRFKPLVGLYFLLAESPNIQPEPTPLGLACAQLTPCKFWSLSDRRSAHSCCALSSDDNYIFPAVSSGGAREDMRTTSMKTLMTTFRWAER